MRINTKSVSELVLELKYLELEHVNKKEICAKGVTFYTFICDILTSQTCV